MVRSSPARLRPSILALLVVAVAPAALAQPAPPGREPPPGGGPQRLFITPAGEPIRDGGLPAWFARADTDHDGALTRTEFRIDAMSFFARLDENQDGRIDGQENQAYETRIAPEILGGALEGRQPFGGEERGPPRGGERGPGKDRRGSGGPGDGGRGGERREGAARFGLLNEPQPVRGADADLDWRVTAEEWSKAAGRRFDLLDHDHDGRLTQAALPRPGGRPGPGR